MSRGPMSMLLLSAALLLAVGKPAHAQQRGGGGNPRTAASIDLTGYWVSVVTEDWRFRMVTAPRGEVAGVPVSGAGRQLANVWDPAGDAAAGEQCRAYGAAGVMRLPTRLHIVWENDTTLRIDTDAGTQTRLLHFGAGAPPAGPRSWQGHSIAQWETATVAAGQPRTGTLRVVTTNMRMGYLRKNGVPYGENAVLTEWFDRIDSPIDAPIDSLIDAPNAAPAGDSWIVVTSEVVDPQYLTGPFVTTTHFRKVPDDVGWNPTPCSAE